MSAFTFNGLTYIGEIEVDAVLRENDILSNTVTDHEVEATSGEALSSVVDHVRRKPRYVTIDGMISGSPMSDLLEPASFADNRADLEAGVNVRTPATVMVELEEMHASARFVTITTPRRVYKNMVMESLTFPRSKETGNSLTFVAAFREVRLVSNRQTFVKVTRVTKMKPKVEQGTKPLEEVTNPPAVPTSAVGKSPLDVGGFSSWARRKRAEQAARRARGG